jgi:MFS family permease
MSERLRMLALLSASALTIMAAATLSPALPAIEGHFANTPQVALLTRLVVTLPALWIALCAPLAGVIADRWGRRPLLLGSILLYGVAGMSGLAFDSLHAILAGRALLGIAVAGIMTAVTALAGDYYGGCARERYMGLQAAFTGFGGLLFLAAGGVLAEWHWRAPFAVYALAFLIWPLVLWHLAEPPPAVPAPGGGASSAQAEAVPGALALLLAAAVLNSAAFYLVPTQLPFHLLSFGVDAPSRTGLAIGTMTLVSALSALAYSRLRPRLGLTGTFAFGFGLMGAGFGLLSQATAFAQLTLALAAVGCGLGTVMPSLMSTAVWLAPQALRGRIAGLLTTAIFLGHFLSPLLSQPLIAQLGFAATFRSVGLMLAVMALAALGLTIAGRRRAPAVAEPSR